MPSDKDKTQASQSSKPKTDAPMPGREFSRAKTIDAPKAATDVSSGSGAMTQSVFATFNPSKDGNTTKSIDINYDLKRVQKRQEHLLANQEKKTPVDTTGGC